MTVDVCVVSNNSVALYARYLLSSPTAMTLVDLPSPCTSDSWVTWFLAWAQKLHVLLRDQMVTLRRVPRYSSLLSVRPIHSTPSLDTTMLQQIEGGLLLKLLHQDIYAGSAVVLKVLCTGISRDETNCFLLMKTK